MFWEGCRLWELVATGGDRMWRLDCKTIILLALAGYEMIIANLALRVSLPTHHLISNVHSWNNC